MSYTSTIMMNLAGKQVLSLAKLSPACFPFVLHLLSLQGNHSGSAQLQHIRRRHIGSAMPGLMAGGEERKHSFYHFIYSLILPNII